MDQFVYEYFRDGYHVELERIARIRERTSFATAFMTAVGAGLAYYANDFPKIATCPAIMFFHIPYIAATVLFLSAFGEIVRAHNGKHRYCYLGDPVKMLKYMQGEIADHQEHESARLSICKTLADRYAEATLFNSDLNKRRESRLIRATKRSLFAICCMFCAFPYFIVHKTSERENLMNKIERNIKAITD